MWNLIKGLKASKQANSKKKSVRNRQKPTTKVETSCFQVKKKKQNFFYLKGFKNSFQGQKQRKHEIREK